MESNQLQQQLFSFLKECIPPHLSLVEELCDLLNLSHDSVYRRIRGEKPITLAELKIICEKYHISLDQLLQLENESVLFDAPGLNVMPAEFSDYLNAVLNQFKYFNSFTTREMHYLCKDSTIWNFYLFPELAAFKTFFWSKTINNQAALSNKMFSFEEFPYHDCFLLGQQVLKEYNQIPSVELWNLESMHSTLNQIAYYRDAGNFKSKHDLALVINAFVNMVDHLQLQAERGVKFMPGDTELSYRASIQFFINELILGNNTMVINLDGKKISMVTYSVFHYLFTKDPRFSTKVMASFDTLLNRSTHVSKTGEKDRNRFFNNIREKIKALG
ncbi:MAG: hypothetical protein IPL04_15610 [Chitinophagaceae bacterium]|nr:hypothetical protein [Chitinophagaceae bacterium]